MTNFGTRTAKTGGGSASADGIAYSNWTDGDKLLVMEDGECSPHLFDEDESAAESVPEIIKPDDAGSDNGRLMLQAVLAKWFRSRYYAWCEDFDQETAAVQLESGINANFWTTAGTNYAAANVTYEAGAGGTLSADSAGADDDSVTILGLPNIRIDANPIVEARFKIDAVANAFIGIGLAEGSFADKAAPDDDICLIGIDSDNGHGYGAARLLLMTNDNNGGLITNDCGVSMADDTFVTVRFDLVDTEKPRVWINDAEVDATDITGTVQAGTSVAPYIMVQQLAGAITRTLTIDYIKVWQERA